MKDIIETWRNALGQFLHQSMESFEPTATAYDLEDNVAVLCFGDRFFEAKLQDLAEVTGRTHRYLSIEFEGYEDYEILQYLEINFYAEEQREVFFSKLRDSIVAQSKIHLVHESQIDLVDELESQYKRVWKSAPNLPNAPFPNLDNYYLSFMASGH